MIKRHALAAAFVITASVVVFANDVRISPIPTDSTHVLVSISARDSWTLGTHEFLQAGMQVMFDYQVELRRPAFLWLFETVLARAPVQAIAKFDPLTAAYAVSRMRNGTTFDAKRLTQESDVREWLTTFDQVELDPVSPLEPNAEYYVQVALTIQPRRSVPSLLSLNPFGHDDNVGRKTFTYIK